MADEKYKFAKIVIHANPDAPLAFEMHSVRRRAVIEFVEDIEAGAVEFAVLEFDTPAGPKRFAIRPRLVISVDTIMTEGSGPKAAKSPIVVPDGLNMQSH